MKIAVPPYDERAIGGGWSFISNFKRAMGENITGYAEADVFLIPSASMVQRADVEQAKADGKKIVLRVDNIIRNSRNRNTGMSRMRDMAVMADLVVFQSRFAFELLDPYLKAEHYTIIHNSVDEAVFNTEGRTEGRCRFLYAKYSSDETKNWEMARSAFQLIELEDKSLTLVGRFEANLEQYGFDFYQGEKVSYKGLVDRVGMAEIYKQSDFLLYSYFNDACSNTLIEALSCGLKIVDCYGMLGTGGAPELMRQEPEYFKLDRMADEYLAVMEAL